MRQTPSEFKWVLFAIATTFSSVGIAGQSMPESLSAEKILATMADRYKSCKSYSDSGVVKTIFFQSSGSRTAEQHFSTAFVRPDRFRFEFREQFRFQSPEVQFIAPLSIYVVWRRGKEVRTWWDAHKPHQETLGSLAEALSGATGVSRGSAHTIPALLLPEEVHGRCPTDVTDAVRAEDARLGTVECFRVQGKYANFPITLWIEKGTFLLRSMDLQQTFTEFRTETTTTYDPVINGEVSDKMLEFHPPN